MTLLFILGFLLVTSIVVFAKPKLIIWLPASLVYLAIIHKLCHAGLFLTIVLAAIVLVVSIVGLVKPLRYLIVVPLFSMLKKVLPSISETEQLALNAGDSWYEKEVFQGKPNFDVLHNIKKFELTEEEQSFLDNETNELCRMIDDWKTNHVDRDLSPEVWQYICKNKFLGLVIKKEFGGKGFSAAAHSQIVMKVATKSVSGAVTVMVPNSLGPGELLYHYGTEEQKNYYLPRLADGIEIPCFALTGPTAGSDATAIPDKGVVCMGEHDGKQVLGIRLSNVNKRYITLAPIATLVGLAFKLEDPENLLNGVGKVGITCALLPHDHKGLEIGNRLYPVNQAFMNGTVRIEDSFIPIDWIIGGQTMAGEGWRMLVECLSIGRAISLPACGTGNALFSTVTTSAYSAVREQFKVNIGSFEGIEDPLAKMGGLAYMLNATRQLTVTAVDSGVRPSVASAIAKYHLTQRGKDVLDHAMDIHAGRAVIMGPTNYLARAYQGAPVGITVEGANIMTRNLLIFGQGVMRSHPYLRSIYESLMNPKGVAEFDKALYGIMGYYAQNKVRAIFHAFTCGKLAKGYDSRFAKYYKQITRVSATFAHISDTALFILGGELKRRERISARLGDVMSHLYMACATLKYFKDNGERKSDEIFVEWTMQYCLNASQTALFEVLDNFPIKAIGKVLKFVSFPYGAVYSKPSDELEQKLAQALIHDCDTRKAFKKLCYIPHDETVPAGKMEVAYQAVLASWEVKAKISRAIKAKQLPKANVAKNAPKALELGIITQEEFEKLSLAAKLSNEVIQVDEFKPYELGPKNAHPEWANA